MRNIDNQSRLPATTTPHFLNQGFIWANDRRAFIKTRKFSGIASLLRLPLLAFEIFMLFLIISLLLFCFSLYVIFRLLIYLPKTRKKHSLDY